MNDNKPDRITLKDAYEELWRCRDFELKHLWQRSVFLGAFLFAVFSGYGSFIGECHSAIRAGSRVWNVYGFGFACVGIFLSLLWIMLAKGSKAWYERYESAISHFFELADLSKEAKAGMVEEGADGIIAFAYGDNFSAYSSPVSNWLFNTKGGAYSPSKINIAVGHLSLISWLAVAIVHLALMRSADVSRDTLCLVLPTGLVFGLLFFWLYAKRFLTSGILEETE